MLLNPVNSVVFSDSISLQKPEITLINLFSLLVLYEIYIKLFPWSWITLPEYLLVCYQFFVVVVQCAVSCCRCEFSPCQYSFMFTNVFHSFCCCFFAFPFICSLSKELYLCSDIFVFFFPPFQHGSNRLCNTWEISSLIRPWCLGFSFWTITTFWKLAFSFRD